MKHKIIQDIAILKICMKLYQNQSIHESMSANNTFQKKKKNSHFDLDFIPRKLKLVLDQDIIILTTWVKLHQSRSINKGDRVITMFFLNSHCDLDLGFRMLILNLDQDIVITDSCVK